MTETKTNEIKNSSISFINSLARSLVISKLTRFKYGYIRLEDGAKHYSFGSKTDTLRCRIRVINPDFYRFMAMGGSLGAAEAFMDGLWEVDDLTALCRIVVQNGEARDKMERGWGWVAKPAHQIFHKLHRNTTQNSKRNIAAHYDLGNDFFRLFLDENLMYSSAIFPETGSSLEVASQNKLDRICRKLELEPNDHIIEIGTGWGGFALYAAKHYGCKVTTTTISAEQYCLAKKRARDAGLHERIEVKHTDYRNLTGQFDKLVSIEMIEAVGHHYYDTYFSKCSGLLKPDGLMLLQAITIGDWFFDAHKRTVDFIKRYIFPGSCIPSVSAISKSIAKETDLRIVDLLDIGPHYARTLRIWRERFFSSINSVREQGFNEEFIRMWHFYLCYCEAGFSERYISDAQILFAKPKNRRHAELA
ncbi:MAG: cyclopropane-fatty-acyl-phospholipid synthase family protein [Candidatus Latescibacterota bacterium]|nr:cyclopropane-fatty-acyl-phospholipid synthase family protein [Candidatus Latescibacterota bacterium]